MGKNSNFKIFTLCLCIASLLWLLNEFGTEFKNVSISHPIQINLPKKNSKIYIKPPNTIEIQVSAKGWDIVKYKFLKQKAVIINARLGRYFLTRNELNRAFRRQLKTLVFHKVLVKSIRLKK